MPLDPRTGVHYELHGKGAPLFIGLPLMASHLEIFGAASAPILEGYLDRLVDRYHVLLVDYPSIGASRDIAPQELTADRVCADLLGVASAAGFDRFAFFGYSWSAQVGLQLASRTDRLTALAIGGWPPLGGPYREILEGSRRNVGRPEASSLVILRSREQYAQWVTYNESVQSWREAEAVMRIACPKMVFYGAEGDVDVGGVRVPIASTIRARRDELEAQGWRVLEIAGEGHGVTHRPDLVVPPVRAFLADVL